MKIPQKSQIAIKDIKDIGKIPVFLDYYSITFDETEMVRIPVWCYRNDVRSIDVFRYNTESQ